MEAKYVVRLAIENNLACACPYLCAVTSVCVKSNVNTKRPNNKLLKGSSNFIFHFQ